MGAWAWGWWGSADNWWTSWAWGWWGSADDWGLSANRWWRSAE